MDKPVQWSDVVFMHKRYHFNRYEEICLIDDDKAFLRLHDMLIEALYSYPRRIQFSDISSAFTHIVRQPKRKRLIFLDLEMGMHNGFELLEKLRKNQPINVDVIILTNSENPKSVTQAKNYSCVSAFIIKPLSSKLLKKIAAPNGMQAFCYRISRFLKK